ncbi:hypothetical protein OQA88_3893 [Cercophora sp. LCS_1]
MAPPSALVIATQAVQRLVKEESYYHKEQASQEERIAKLEEAVNAGGPDLDNNSEYMLKQEKTALEETKKVFEPLKERIVRAVQKLEEQIAISESEGNAPEDELTKAKEALKSGQKVGGLEDEA